ncbi:hypothetical protein [Palleronia marisminoris]|uniref:hypothetical protein n=1 Tax=Palleronia marisminoris TaxID=315423 RepID=UPI001C31DFDB|nr:hypothetical protein [Palleronia marisminoris]
MRSPDASGKLDQRPRPSGPSARLLDHRRATELEPHVLGRSALNLSGSATLRDVRIAMAEPRRESLHEMLSAETTIIPPSGTTGRELGIKARQLGVDVPLKNYADSVHKSAACNRVNG